MLRNDNVFHSINKETEIIFALSFSFSSPQHTNRLKVLIDLYFLCKSAFFSLIQVALLGLKYFSWTQLFLFSDDEGHDNFYLQKAGPKSIQFNATFFSFKFCISVYFLFLRLITYSIFFLGSRCLPKNCHILIFLFIL